MGAHLEVVGDAEEGAVALGAGVLVVLPPLHLHPPAQDQLRAQEATGKSAGSHREVSMQLCEVGMQVWEGQSLVHAGSHREVSMQVREGQSLAHAGAARRVTRMAIHKEGKGGNAPARTD